MSLTRCRRRQGRVAATFVAVLLFASAAGAQNVAEPSLKAAFIYNFAKFTTWPPDVLPVTGSFTACVIGDNSVFEALERAVKGRQVSGHGVAVQLVPPDGPARGCHLLYLSGVAPGSVATILTAIRGLPILTISDLDRFTGQGGIVQMFLENGRTRFDLNLDVARQSRLQISSRLLVLGAHVFDGAKAGEGR